MRIRSALGRLQILQADQRLVRQINRVETYLASQEQAASPQEAPVLFFNASTRIHRLSLNAAFSLLASWRVRQSGIPVRYLACDSGMIQCVLGTNPDSDSARPPCRRCIGFSRKLFPEHMTDSIIPDERLTRKIYETLEGLSVEELQAWEYKETPLGALSLPGLRWALRRHHLENEPITLELYRQYLSSAANLHEWFEVEFDRISPRALVLFNGIFFPEAVARAVAQRMGIRVITHEVGLRPYSAFFSHDHATFREVEVSEEIRLSEQQNKHLDDYLSSRFRGDFSMAGVQFWEEIHDLPVHLQSRIDSFAKIVSVFSNVIFDTSQLHANTIFIDMFDWLDELIPIIEENTDVLFVLRAHPDENRFGKASRETVAQWLTARGLDQQENFAFIGPDEGLNSYDLIRNSDLVLIYNSSIGLEGAILSKPVLAAGRARFSGNQVVLEPKSRDDYIQVLKNSLGQDINPRILEESRINARKFLYHELYQASLDLSTYLNKDPLIQGMVLFTEFAPKEIEIDKSLQVIQQGILDGAHFYMPE